MTTPPVPLIESSETGYALDRVFFQRILVETVVGAPAAEEKRSAPISIAWDWGWLAHDVFDVNLTLDVAATQERDEHVGVTAIARFRTVGAGPSVEIEQFAQSSAPAILLPYVRNMIHFLTTNGRFAPLLLPPLNVQAMMQTMDQARTTARLKGRPSPAQE